MSAGIRLRVLCYNIRHAQGIGGIISNGRIARVITGARCEVAGLTEVWRVAGRFDQPSLLEGLTGMTATFHALQRGFGRESGNAALSMLPVLGVRHIELGGRREQRGCLLVDTEKDGVGFSFATTHLALDRATRKGQIEKLVAELPTDRPLILMGDFNCGLAELEPLMGLLTLPRDVPATYPSPVPFRSLDHIAFSSHWRLESLEAIKSWASDHLPLVAELSMVSD